MKTTKIHLSHSERCNAKPETVFGIWRKVEEWPAWDKGLSACEFKGQFAKGSQFKLTPTGAPGAVDATITEVEENVRFVDVASVPFGKLSFIHEVKAVDDGCEITHSIEATIDLHMARAFEESLLPKIRKDLAPSVKALAQLAEVRA